MIVSACLGRGFAWSTRSKEQEGARGQERDRFRVTSEMGMVVYPDGSGEDWCERVVTVTLDVETPCRNC